MKINHDHHLSWAKTEQENNARGCPCTASNMPGNYYHTVKYYGSTGNNRGFSSKPWALQLEDRGRIGDWKGLAEHVKIAV